MRTVTLNHNPQNEIITSILHSAVVAGASIVENKRVATKTLSPFEKSIEDIKKGRVTKVKNIDCVIEEILR